MVINISVTGVSIKCVIMMASITSEMEMNIKDNTKLSQTSTECAMVTDNSKLLDLVFILESSTWEISMALEKLNSMTKEKPSKIHGTIFK